MIRIGKDGTEGIHALTNFMWLLKCLDINSAEPSFGDWQYVWIEKYEK